jgi:hypothetical protein
MFPTQRANIQAIGLAVPLQLACLPKGYTIKNEWQRTKKRLHASSLRIGHGYNPPLKHIQSILPIWNRGLNHDFDIKKKGL